MKNNDWSAACIFFYDLKTIHEQSPILKEELPFPGYQSPELGNIRSIKDPPLGVIPTRKFSREYQSYAIPTQVIRPNVTSGVPIQTNGSILLQIHMEKSLFVEDDKKEEVFTVRKEGSLFIVQKRDPFSDV